MGSSGSKEEGLPVKYARGCSSSEFSKEWRNNAKYKMMKDHLSKGNIEELNRSCITIAEDKNYNDMDPSVMLLGESNVPISRIPPRLQSIGIKQKSYVDQLIELRTKNMAQSKDKNEGRNIEQETEENSETEVIEMVAPVELNPVTDTGLLMNKRLVTKGTAKEIVVQMKSRETKIKKDIYLMGQDDDDTFSEHPPTRPSSPSWTNSQSEEVSVSSNYSGGDGLEHIRSDVTVVPYDQAKARFETGNHKKRPKRNEAYMQLEQLGLGFWNKDQWVPTKVVTLALSDQLSCAGGDWPTNYRFRSSYNCQSFRSSFSEVRY